MSSLFRFVFLWCTYFELQILVSTCLISFFFASHIPLFETISFFYSQIMLSRVSFLSSLISLLIITHSDVTHAFSGPKQGCGTSTSTTTKMTRMNLPTVARSPTTDHHPTLQSSATSLILSLTILGNTVGASALAVSGGGLDYANIDITGQVRTYDRSNGTVFPPLICVRHMMNHTFFCYILCTRTFPTILKRTREKISLK